MMQVLEAVKAAAYPAVEVGLGTIIYSSYWLLRRWQMTAKLD
jgi:hypothetical protein